MIHPAARRGPGALPALAVLLFATGAGCAGGAAKYPEVRARSGRVTIDLTGLAGGMGTLTNAARAPSIAVTGDGRGSPGSLGGRMACG